MKECLAGKKNVISTARKRTGCMILELNQLPHLVMNRFLLHGFIFLEEWGCHPELISL